MRALAMALLIASTATAQLPPIDFPAENPPSPDKALLGKFLFWEEQLSGDNTMACGTCHVPELGGSDPRAFDADSVHPGFDGTFGTADDVRGSKGVVSFDANGPQFAWEGTFFPSAQVTARRAPTVLNVGLYASGNASVPLFWDGSAPGTFVDPQTGEVAIVENGALESQAVAPPVSAVEMGGAGTTWEAIATKLADVTPLALAGDVPAEMTAFRAAFPTYPDMFAAVFGSPEISARRIAFAIADYERTLISDETPMDLQFEGVEPVAPELEPGLDLFMEACHVCHNAPLTFDYGFHNIGVRPDEEDPGLAGVTGDPADLGRFKTPQLRNVSLRLPVFHDGSAATLEEVVDFYDQGGGFDTNGLKDAILLPLGLTEQQKADLVLFLEQGLLDPRVPAGEPPFDRPTLGSEARASNVRLGAGSPGAGGVVPQVLAHVPANLGNGDFMLGMYDAAPDQPAWLAFATAAAPGTPVAGVTFNLDLASLFLIVAGTTDANGVATVALPIPKSAAFAGVVVYANWAVADPLAPAGLATTEGVEVTLL